MRILVAIPVHNEALHVEQVLDRVLQHAGNVLVVDDGSTDATPALLNRFPIDVIRHAVNRGYGRSIQNAFRWAVAERYDWLITMDCDEQHEPDEIPMFAERAERAARDAELGRGGADIISGSRYMVASDALRSVPPERRAINVRITAELNQRLGLALTDAFCGFKAYRVAALPEIQADEDGYAFPMQVWVQAAAAGLRVREAPVSLIYNDPNRSFGATLDDAGVRLAYYRRVMHDEILRYARRLPGAASHGLVAETPVVEACSPFCVNGVRGASRP